MYIEFFQLNESKNKNYQSKKQQGIKKPFKNKKKDMFPGKAPIDEIKLEQHSRGEGVGQGVKHSLHAIKLKKREQKISYAQEQAARADILLTEEAG